MTPDVVQFITACLDEDNRERVKKQRHTACRIYQRLVEECGFTGSESSVRNLVHDLGVARKETKVFVPLKFAPGEAVQIDWGGIHAVPARIPPRPPGRDAGRGISPHPAH